MKKVTKYDILNIKPGKTKVFVLDDAKGVRSAKSYIYQMAKIEPPQGVKRFICHADYSNNTLVVEAVAAQCST